MTYNIYYPRNFAAILPRCQDQSYAFTLDIQIISANSYLNGVPGTQYIDLYFGANNPLMQSFDLYFDPADSSVLFQLALWGTLGDWAALPYTEWTILPQTTDTVNQWSIVWTDFRTDPSSIPHYLWLPGPSAAANTGIAYMTGGAYVDLHAVNDIPDSPQLMPLTWGPDTLNLGIGDSRSSGYTVGGWFLINTADPLTYIRLFECYAYDTSLYITWFIEPEDDASHPSVASTGVRNSLTDVTWYQSTPVSLAAVTPSPTSWTSWYLSVRHDGATTMYINYTRYELEPRAGGWVVLGARPNCYMTDFVNSASALFQWWDRHLTHPEILLLKDNRPRSTCLAPCVYARSIWGSFFNQRTTQGGYRGHASIPQTGYLVWSADSTNAFQYSQAADFLLTEGPMPALLPPSMPPDGHDGQQFSMCFWVMTSTPIAFTKDILWWTSTPYISGAHDQVRVSIDNAFIQVSYSLGSSAPVTLQAAYILTVGQFMHLCVTSNLQTVTIYANSFQVGQSTTMPLLNYVHRVGVMMSQGAWIHLASFHLFPYVMETDEIRTLTVYPPDSLFQHPLIYLDAPISMAVGATATFQVVLPLPWAIFPAGSPTSLNVTATCGAAAISPSSFTLAGSQMHRNVTVSFPANTNSITIVFALSGDAAARYTAPPPLVIWQRAAISVSGSAAWSTEFPHALTQTNGPTWSSGVSARSGIVRLTPGAQLDPTFGGDFEDGVGLSTAFAIDQGYTIAIWIRFDGWSSNTDGLLNIVDAGGNYLTINASATALSLPSSSIPVTFTLTNWNVIVLSFRAPSLAIWCNGMQLGSYLFPPIFSPVQKVMLSDHYDSTVASLRYWTVAFTNAEAQVVSSALAQPYSITARPSPIPLRATAAFSNSFSTQTFVPGWWAGGQSGNLSTGVATLGDPNSGQLIDYTSLSSFEPDTPARWPLTWGTTITGWTVSTWVRNDAPMSNYPRVFACHRAGASDGDGVQVVVSPDYSQVSVSYLLGSGTSSDYVYPIYTNMPPPIFTGQWNLWTIVATGACSSGDNLFVYVNGKVIVQGVLPLLPVVPRTCYSTGWGQGYLATMDFYQRSLLPSEILTLVLSPPTNIYPAYPSLTFTPSVGLTMPTPPLFMGPGASETVYVTLPYPLSIWGVATTQQYRISFATLPVLTTPPIDMFLTDAVPTGSLSLVFPTAAVSMQVCLSIVSGDVLHYNPSYCFTITLLTPASVFASAAFKTFFDTAPIHGVYSTGPPPSVRATGLEAVNFYDAVDVGNGGSGILPSVIGTAGGGLTFATYMAYHTEGYFRVLDSFGSSSTANVFNIYQNMGSGFVTFVTDSLGGNNVYAGASTPLPGPDIPFLLVVTIDLFNVFHFYLNSGTEFASINYSPGVLNVPRPTAQINAAYGDASIYSAAYWPRCLTPAEVASISRKLLFLQPVNIPNLFDGNVFVVTASIFLPVGANDLTLTPSAGGSGCASMIAWSPSYQLIPANSNVRAVNFTMTINTASMPTGGVCSITITPTGVDGPLYTPPEGVVTIVRFLGNFTKSFLPSPIYAGQSFSISLTPSVGPLSGVSVQVAGSGITFSSGGLLSWSSASVSTKTTTATAPAACTVVDISYMIGGSDQASYTNITDSSFTVASPTGNVTIVCVPPVGSTVAAAATITCLASLTETPLYTPYTMNFSTTVGSASPTFLSWNGNHAAQTFSYQTPSSGVYTASINVTTSGATGQFAGPHIRLH